MIKILFVCHGNICRSPMAEFVMKHLVNESKVNEIYIESAATSTEELGNDMHRGTKEKLRNEGIPFKRRSARQMTKSDYSSFEYIIAMDSNNIRNISRIIKTDSDNKVYKLLDFTNRKGSDIADPWYTGNFDATYNDILEGCKGLLKYISELNTNT